MDAAARARRALRTVRDVLEAEGDRRSLPGLDAALRALGPVEADVIAARDGLREAASIHRAMTRGPGAFADVHVWRADPDERTRANAPLDAALDELWTVLGDLR